MTKKKTEMPPKTRLAFNVCFTGHRLLPELNVELLQGQIVRILQEIDGSIQGLMQDIGPLHKDEPPILRVLSMLAEGSDRISAECALRSGYRLQCPLPMKREEYEKDFVTPESKNEFNRLLSQAESVFEIEAGSEIRSRSYQDCGHVMLAQSDILIAIWDGKDSGKIGGTSDMVDYSKQHDIPIIWIDSCANHEISFLYGDKTRKDWAGETKAVVKNILYPWHHNKANKFMPENYLRENCAKRRRSRLYAHVIKLLSHHHKRKAGPLKQQAEALPVNEFYKKNFQKHYECADYLAQYYRDIYRSCGILRQLLPFIASIGLAVGFYVVLIGGPGGAQPYEANVLTIIGNIGFLIQPLCFLLIILLSKIDTKNHWHQKYTDYRALSELLRHMEYLAPAGLIIRGLRASALGHNVNLSWVNWQFRAIVREAGLPSCSADEGMIRDSYSYLNKEIIESQIRYHEANREKMQFISARLEKFGMAVYYVSIAVFVLRIGARFLTSGTLLPLNSGQKSYVSSLFNMLSMVIPLFSTLSFGISTQEGFARIGQLSSEMRSNLQDISIRLESVRVFNFSEYKKLSQYAADLMLSELSDWNIFIKSKLISDH